MLKKTLIFVAIVGVLISMTILPVSAAYFYHEEFYGIHPLDLNIQKVTNDDGITVYCHLPIAVCTEWFYATEWEDGVIPDVYDQFVETYYVEDNWSSWFGRPEVYNPLAGRIWPLGPYNAGTYNAIDVSDFKEGHGFDFNFTYSFNGFLEEGSAPAGPSIDFTFIARWYSHDYAEEFFEETFIYKDNGSWQEFDGSGSVSFTVPEGAEYCVIGCIAEGLRADTYFEMCFEDITLSAKISSFEENSKTMQAIQKELETLNDVVVNGTPEQNQQISGANDKMNAAGDQLGELSEQMQVEKPDVSDMDVSINRFIPETSILAYTGPILAFWNNDSLKAMLIIVLTLVLVSWVMFGKKG